MNLGYLLDSATGHPPASFQPHPTWGEEEGQHPNCHHHLTWGEEEGQHPNRCHHARHVLSQNPLTLLFGGWGGAAAGRAVQGDSVNH